MASAWGKAWGAAWGNAWGAVREPVDPIAVSFSGGVGGGPDTQIPLSEWRRRHAPSSVQLPAATRKRRRREMENEMLMLGLL